LFFTSQRPGGEGSTWALRMDAPGGEAFQLDTYPEGSVPADARFVVFTDPANGGDDEEEDEAEEPGGENAPDEEKDDPFASMPAMARPPFGSVTRPLDPKRFDGRHIIDLGY